MWRLTNPKTSVSKLEAPEGRQYNSLASRLKTKQESSLRPKAGETMSQFEGRQEEYPLTLSRKVQPFVQNQAFQLIG